MDIGADLPMYMLPKAITFDCYGTLIDWEGEIQRFFAQLLAARGIAYVDTRALQQHWEEVQFQYISQAYHPYHQVLRETMQMTFADYHLPCDEADVAAFAASMGHWRPFPDSREALLALQKILKVVLITNTDDRISAQTQKMLDVTFDDIITAEQAGAYKPSHKGFHLARERLQLPQSDIWHAGFGFKYDIVPATELGYTTVWVNRQGDARPPHVQETFLVGDMRTLVYLVCGIAAPTFPIAIKYSTRDVLLNTGHRGLAAHHLAHHTRLYPILRLYALLVAPFSLEHAQRGEQECQQGNLA